MFYWRKPKHVKEKIIKGVPQLKRAGNVNELERVGTR